MGNQLERKIDQLRAKIIDEDIAPLSPLNNLANEENHVIINELEITEKMAKNVRMEVEINPHIDESKSNHL